MVFREVSVIEVREALRAWLAGKSERAVAAQAGVDRKTSKRYVTAAVAAGLSREGGGAQRTDEPAGPGVWRQVFAACFSRYMFVYLTFSMTLEEVIAGCEDAWEFFSGVFRVVVPDNMSPVVATADAVNPRLTREWLEYSQARGFVTDPARVRHPRDKGRVEAGGFYLQRKFFAGEGLLGLAEARARVGGGAGGAAGAPGPGTPPHGAAGG